MPLKKIAVVSSNNTDSMAEIKNGTVGAQEGSGLGMDSSSELHRQTDDRTDNVDMARTGEVGVGACEYEEGEESAEKTDVTTDPDMVLSEKTETIVTITETTEAGELGDAKNIAPSENPVPHVHADTVILGESDTNRQTDAHVNVMIVNTPNNTSLTPDTQSTDKPSNTRSTGKKKDKPIPLKKKDSIAKETLHANSPTPMSTERCDSSLSNSSLDVCRICQCDSCEIQNDSPLLTPCLCSGSLKYIHQACLQKWIKSSDKMSCELCQFEYQMTKKTKPFREWERLDMTQAERRKVVCSVTFHVIAITCVVWSLYVLIDRTTEEVEAGSLLWPFWTKLIVVAIGFTGGVVFMYVQCKMYLTLCKKWRMYNKVIIISSISESHRDKSNQIGMQQISEKQRQLEEGHVTTLLNVVNEAESV